MKNSKPGLLKRTVIWLKGGSREENSTPDVSGEQSVFMQRAALMALDDILQERSSERRWRMFRRIGLSCIAVTMAMISVWSFVEQHGFIPQFGKPKIKVVNIIGDIGSSDMAKAETVIPPLRRAMHSDAPVVVLRIDSRGGSPGDAEQIVAEIDSLKKETGKKIVAVIGDMGASAAYLIAIHTDKIIAGNYSMVGSIGAIMTSWNVGAWPEKIGVKQEVFKSGPNKDMLNPFRQLSPEEREKAQGLINSIAGTFIADVKAKRGTRLKTDGENLFTGDVWTGPQAKNLGLIDEIGTMGTLLQEYGTQALVVGPNERGRMLFMAEAGEAMVDGMMSGLRKFTTENENLHLR